MKPIKRPIQVSSLDADQLRQSSGGKGTLCGNMAHCPDCGYAWPSTCEIDIGAIYGYFGCMQTISLMDIACPNCGAA